MSSINRIRKNTASPNSSNSNGSIHENTSLSTIETINYPKWSFHNPTSSRNLPRDHHNLNEFGSRYDYANTRSSFVSSYSPGYPDRLAYPSQRSSSVYTYAQAGFTTEHNVQYRSQKSTPYNRSLSTTLYHSTAQEAPTTLYHSTAQEAPAPLFDPFILMDSKVEPRTYNLIIRQSPMHGQMCTLGSKERRILDPLPIVQLDIRDKNGKRDLIGQASPLLIMQVNLIAEQIEVGSNTKTFERNESGSGSSNSPIEMRQNTSPSYNTTYNRIGLPGFASGIEPTTTPPPPPTDSDSQLLPKPHETHFSALRLLEGKLTASPHIVKDVENHLDMRERIGSDWQKKQKGESDVNPKRRSSMPFPSTKSNEPIEEIQEDQKACFFIFTDLSIRLRGTFRLEFSLIKLGLPFSTSTKRNNSAGEIVARIKSEPFSIFHARDFAGMTESTPLAKSLAMQGVHIPIRNDSRWKGRLQTQQQQQQQTRTNKSSTEDNSPSSASLTTARSSSTPKSNLKSQ